MPRVKPVTFILSLSILMPAFSFAQQDPDEFADNPELKALRLQKAILTAQAAVKTAETELQTAEDAQEKDIALTEAAKAEALAKALKAQAEAETAASTAQKTASEAELAALAAKYPAGTTTPLSGAITLDSAAGYYTQLLAHDALKEVAGKIGAKLTTLLDGTEQIWIVQDLENLAETVDRLVVESKLAVFKKEFTTITNQLNVIKPGVGSILAEIKRIETQRTPVPPPAIKSITSFAALTALESGISGFADIAAFFKTERDIDGKTVTFDSHILEQAVIDAYLTNATQKASIVLPNSILNPSAGYVILDDFNKLINDYVQSKGKRDDIEQALKAAKAEMQAIVTKQAGVVSKLKDDNAQKPAEQALLVAMQTEQAKITPYEEDLVIAKTTLTEFNTFSTALTTPPESGSARIIKIAANAIISKADTAATNGKVYLLLLKVWKVGGELETRKSLWGSSVRHRAGVVCGYTMVRRDGSIVGAGTFSMDRQSREGQYVKNLKAKGSRAKGARAKGR